MTITLTAAFLGDKASRGFQERLRPSYRELEKLGGYRPRFLGAGIPSAFSDEPGIIDTYNIFPKTDEGREVINEACKKGWLLVHELSTDVFRFRQTNAIRSAHIVICASKGWYDYAKTINPNSYFIPTQIGVQPPFDMVKNIKTPQQILMDTVFAGKWKDGGDYVRDTLLEHSDHIQVSSINSTEYVKSLSPKIAFNDMAKLNYIDHIKLLDHIDIMLFPVNVHKTTVSVSDLRLVEALAHGVVPVTTRNVAKTADIPEELLVIIDENEDWSRRLNDLLDEPESMLEMKAKGWEYVKQNRLWDGHIHELDELLKSSFENQSALELERMMRLETQQNQPQKGQTEEDSPQSEPEKKPKPKAASPVKPPKTSNPPQKPTAKRAATKNKKATSKKAT